VQSELLQTITDLKAENAALKAPQRPSPELDAILKAGKRVGSVVCARQVRAGMWCFATITIGPDFSSAGPIQYRDYLLELAQAEGHMQRGGAGQSPAVTVFRPVCRVIGRT